MSPDGRPSSDPDVPAAPGSSFRARIPRVTRVRLATALSFFSLVLPVFLVYLVCVPTLTAADTSPTPTPAAAPNPVPHRVPSGRTPKLSSKEKAARIRELSEDDRQWLTEYVAPIILPDEENLFLQLPAGYPRAMFREEFWKRRERDGMPEPFGPGYRTRYEHLLEVADSDYDGRFGEAGRLVVRRGEPAFIQEFKDCSEVFRQAEVWTYRPNGSTGKELQFLFYRSSFGAPRKLWFPGDTEIFQTASCVATFDQACGATGQAQPGGGSQCIGSMSVAKGCQSACYVARIADEIRGRGMASVAAEAAFAPGVSTEGVDGLWQRLATSSDPNAKQIGVEGPSSSLSTGPRAAAIPEPTPAVWDAASIRDRIIALPKKYRDFLDVAAPIMADAELVAFLQARPSDRDTFIRKFWRQHGKKG